MPKEKLKSEQLTPDIVCEIFKKKFKLNYGLLVKDSLYYKRIYPEEFFKYLVKQFTIDDFSQASFISGISSVFEFFSENYATKKSPYFSLGLSEVPLMKDCMLYLFYSEEDLCAHIDYLARTKAEETRQILNSGYTHILKVTL